MSRCISRFYDFRQSTLYRKSLISRCLEHAHIYYSWQACVRVYIGLHLGTAVLFCYSWQLSAALFAKLCVSFHMKYTATLHHFVQERMIVRGGGRACNFARFGDGRNNPPVLYLETRAKHVVQFCAVVHRKLLYLVRYKYSARSTGVNWSYTLFLLRVQSCALVSSQLHHYISSCRTDPQKLSKLGL